jgi:hypothetical protein
LLWNHRGVLLRLEAHVSERTALGIAETMR